MMTKTECRNCDELHDFRPEHTDTYKDSHKRTKWRTLCPVCGAFTEIDPEDYTVPAGTPVHTKDGRGVIVTVSLKAETFSDIEYLIAFDDSSEGWLRRADFEILPDWRRLRNVSGCIERVCHYPRNQAASNMPCYNCVDRTKCNADIFQALLDYELSGFKPDDVQRISRLLSEHGLDIDGLAGLLDSHKKEE